MVSSKHVPIACLQAALGSWQLLTGVTWWQVVLCADLEVGRPARVWLFDDAIVVLRRPGKWPRVCKQPVTGSSCHGHKAGLKVCARA